jgi:6-phosphogluconolactonase (cycloisomerase 2 family)
MSVVKISHSLRFISTVTLLALLMLVPQPGLADGRSGNVYLPTNQPTGNSIMVFHRDAAGVLTFVGSVASGGIGAGTGADPLASQGAVILSRDNRLLFAVNAGSDSVSVFAVSGDRLDLLYTIASGGTLPVSLTVGGNLLYVLNAGGAPNISGFTIESSTNRLVPLAGSTQSLPGGAAASPAQVSFSPDDSVLIVTEKGTNMIDTFAVDDDGVARPGVAFPSSGITPFGFAFGHDNVTIVSDAGSGALSSYAVDEEGNLDLVTPALSDTQAAPCWVVVPRNGRFAYTANAGSGTISSYTAGEAGRLALLDVAAASVARGSAPTDMALSNNSRFLYVRNGGNGTISGFRLNADGSLTLVSTVGGLPAGTQGIVAR